jgi:superfamily II DNA or RNA helicase
MELRDYQKNLVDAINQRWDSGDRRVLAQLPTGGGKTQCFSAIARQFLEKGEGVLVLAHRKELITQARDKLEAISGLPCGVIKAGFPVQEFLPVQVASVQSLVRRKRFPDAGLIIIDEAHHACAQSYVSIMDAYPKDKILGVTATPCRSDGQGFKYLFDSLVTGASASDLIKDGYLSKFRVFRSATKINTKGIRKVGGDYNQSQLEDAARKVIGEIVPTWQKFAIGKSTIVFAVSVEHSREIVQSFQNAGIPAEHIDGETPDDQRDEILKRFRQKETLILSNVNIATEGTDIPGIEAVQCLRPTMSVILHLQMLGRGLRPSPGKDYCVIIDHTDNWSKHGLPDDDREWSLEPMSLRASRFTQCCPSCEHIFRPLSHEQKPAKQVVDALGSVKNIMRATCPSCLESFQWEQGEGGEENGGSLVLEKEEGEIKELDLTLIPEHKKLVDDLIAIAQSKGYKPAWAYHALIEKYGGVAEEFTHGDIRYLAAQCKMKFDAATNTFKEKIALLSRPVELGQPTIGFAEKVEELFEIAQSKGYKPGWVFYRLTEQLEFEPSAYDWLYLAKKMDYPKEWAYKQKRTFRITSSVY